MSRGLLDDSEWGNIYQETPDLDNLGNIVLHLSPDFLSIPFSPESNVPIAAVCFQDAFNTFGEALYALREVFAHQIWYLEKKKPPNEMAAAFFGRFYADDAALRLYSAGEHLANGIIMMLEITDEDLNPYKKKRISQQSIVGHFLKEQKPHHPITKAVSKLVDSQEWSATMDHRNRWVHKQPPTVKGLGIVYKRRRRWEALPNGKRRILLGGGDTPDYTIDNLLEFIKPAMFQFTDTITTVVEFYIEILEASGSIRFNTQQEVNHESKMP